MAKIQITKTELVWPGKYREDGILAETPRSNLPLENLELFGPETEWRNKLIWGDNLLVMGSLLEKFAGKIDLIYIDPPFATGADFSIGHQQVAYRDTWKAWHGRVPGNDGRTFATDPGSALACRKFISALRLACESPAASDRR